MSRTGAALSVRPADLCERGAADSSPVRPGMTAPCPRQVALSRVPDRRESTILDVLDDVVGQGQREQDISHDEPR